MKNLFPSVKKWRITYEQIKFILESCIPSNTAEKNDWIYQNMGILVSGNFSYLEYTESGRLFNKHTLSQFHIPIPCLIKYVWLTFWNKNYFLVANTTKDNKPLKSDFICTSHAYEIRCSWFRNWRDNYEIEL